MEKLRATYDIELSYTFFPLHPDTPDKGLTLEELFAGRGMDIAAAQERIAQRIADEGLPFGKRTMTYNSRLAQELGKWAETQPNGDKIHNALFQAYFVNNLNLANVGNLLKVIDRVELNTAEAENVLVQRTYQQAVDADWRRARAIGVSAVPTFVVDRSGLAGAQPYEQLERFVIDAGAEKRR